MKLRFLELFCTIGTESFNYQNFVQENNALYTSIKSPFPLSTEAPTDILISLIIVIMTWFGGQAAFIHFNPLKEIKEVLYQN